MKLLTNLLHRKARLARPRKFPNVCRLVLEPLEDRIVLSLATATWTGAFDHSSWNAAGNWSPAVVPNNGGGTTYNVLIDNGANDKAVVNIGGISPSISDLTVDSGNTLNLANNNSLTIAGGAGAGTITNNGAIDINSAGNFTDLILSGAAQTITLTGSGTLTMSNNGNNRIYGSGTQTLFVDTNQTIQGSGQFGLGSGASAFTLTNNGTIDANQTSALTINPGNGTTNNSTLEATNSGTLNLGGTINNGSSAIIQSSGGAVNLSGATINAGTLTTSNGGTMTSGDATLNGLTISSGSTVTVPNNTATTLQGSITIVASAMLALNSGGNVTDVKLSGNVTLTGGGSVTMSNNGNNRIYGITGSDTLINDVNNTIQGAGLVGINNSSFAFTLTNKGTIDATQSTPLQIAPTSTVIDTGTLEATGGGTLDLGGSFTNTGGTVVAAGVNQATAAISVVNLGGTAVSTLTGGTLTTSGGGAMTGSGATLNGLTISGGSTVTVTNNTATTLQGIITIAPSAALALNSSGNATDIKLSGNVTLTGGGSVTMSNNGNNRIYGITGADTLINDVGNTIQVAGLVGINNSSFAFTLTNKGTIDATQSTPLQIAPTNTVINTGTLEATGGGTLDLGGTFTNTGGTAVAAGVNQTNGAISVVNLGGTAASTITGGTLTTSGGGAMTGSGATLSGLTISSGSTVTVPNNMATTLKGTITIAPSAALVLNSSGNATDIKLSGNVTLTGGGSVTMSNNGNNGIFGLTGAEILINDVNNTIQGAGQLGLGSGANAFALTNNGTIDADLSTALAVNPGNGTTNNATLEATNNGTLNVLGAVNNNSSTGIIQSVGGTVNLSGAAINAGTLTTTSGGALIGGGGAVLNGVTISSGSTVTVLNSTTITLQGTITIKPSAALTVDSVGNFTDLKLSSIVTLTGGGSLTLSNNANNRIYGITSDAALINDVSNTIQGSGQIGINNSTGNNPFTLTNKGIIDANQSNSLQIAPTNAVIDTGILEATGGGTLNLGGTFNVTGGTILATGTNAVINLAGAAVSTINGGTLTTAGGGAMASSGGMTLDGVTISSGSTVTVPNNATTTLQGTITIAPTAALAADSVGNFTDIKLDGIVTLTGGGSLTMSNNGSNRIYGLTGADTLINGVNNTIQGSGQLGVGSGGDAFTLINNGVIDANQSAALTVNTGSATTNNATLESTNSGTLDILGTINNSSSGSASTIQALGAAVNLSGAAINAGTLTTGSGGAMNSGGGAILNGLTISAGSTVTVLNNTTTTLEGIITIDPAAVLTANSVGNFTDIKLSGSVTLTGGGSLTMSNNGNNRIYGITTGAALINDVNNTILGGGQLGVGSGANAFALTNNGTITANQTSTLTIDPGNGATNNGTLHVNSGCTLAITDNLTNFSGTTLTGGTYYVAGTFSLTSAGIVTNAANITLDSSGAAKIQNASNNANALAGFTTNAAAGSITLVGSSGSFAQIQTLTTNNGSIALLGGANFSTKGNLTNAGTLTLGPVSTLTINGGFTQTSAGALTIQLGGTPTTGQFGQLAVAGLANLNGALNVALVNVYGPQVGQNFTIIAFSTENGTFASTSGLTLQGVPQFAINLQAASLTLVAVANAADLAVTGITVPSSGLVNQDVTISYTVQDQEPVATFVASWVDSVYVSSITTLDATAQLLGQVAHSGVVAGQGSYTGTLTAVLPALLPGNYHILVVADSANQVPDSNRAVASAASANLIHVDLTSLTAATPLSGTIADGQNLYYRFDPPAGQDFLVTANFAASPEAGFFISQGQIPTATSFSESSPDPLDLQQSLPLLNAQPPTYFILLQGGAGAGGGAAFTLSATQLGFAVVGVSPALAANVNSTTITVQGSHFTSNTSASLVGPNGFALVATGVQFQNSNTVQATFNLTGVAPGVYHIQLTNGAQVATQSSAFDVFQAAKLLFTDDPTQVDQNGNPLSVWSEILPAPNQGNDSTIALPFSFAGVQFTLNNYLQGQHVIVSGDPSGTQPFTVDGSWTLSLTGPVSQTLTGTGTSNPVDVASLNLPSGTYGGQLTLTAPTTGTQYGTTNIYLISDAANLAEQTLPDAHKPIDFGAQPVSIPVGSVGQVPVELISSPLPFTGMVTHFEYDPTALQVLGFTVAPGFYGGGSGGGGNIGSFSEYGSTPLKPGQTAFTINVRVLEAGNFPISFEGNGFGLGPTTDPGQALNYLQAVANTIVVTGTAPPTLPTTAVAGVTVDPSSGNLLVTITGAGLSQAASAQLVDTNGNVVATTKTLGTSTLGSLLTATFTPVPAQLYSMNVFNGNGNQIATTGPSATLAAPPAIPIYTLARIDTLPQLPGKAVTHIWQVVNQGLVDGVAVLLFIFPNYMTTEPTLVTSGVPVGSVLLDHGLASWGWADTVAIPIAAGSFVDVPWTFTVPTNAVFGFNAPSPLGSAVPVVATVEGALSTSEYTTLGGNAPLTSAGADNLISQGYLLSLVDANNSIEPLAQLSASLQSTYSSLLAAASPGLQHFLFDINSQSTFQDELNSLPNLPSNIPTSSFVNFNYSSGALLGFNPFDPLTLFPTVDQAGLHAALAAVQPVPGTTVFSKFFQGPCLLSALDAANDMAQVLPGNWHLQTITAGSTLISHSMTLLTSPGGNLYAVDTYLGGVCITQMLRQSDGGLLPISGQQVNDPIFTLLPGIEWYVNIGNQSVYLNGKCPVVSTFGNNLQGTYIYGPVLTGSFDPNSIGAVPAGAGSQGFINDTQPITYTVNFENDGNGAAGNIQVTLQVDPNLDPSTIQMGDSSFSGTEFAYDPSSGALTWLLPEINLAPSGQGFVSFSASPRSGLATGTQITEQAQVFFDFNPPIETPIALRTIDSVAPTSRVQALPAVSGPSFTVTWGGQDDPGGSGIAFYNVFVSDNGGTFEPFLLGTSAISAPFSRGLDGHTYSFISIATDNVGNVEPAKSAADATTTVIINASQFNVTAPASATAGSAITVTVTAEDSFGNPVPTYTGTVHFTSSDVQAALPANATLTGGTGTFTVKLKTAAVQSITATDTVTATIGGTANVTVTPAAVNHFTVNTPTGAALGSPISFTVTAQDLYFNTVTNFAGTVDFTSNDPRATLPASTTLTTGVGRFSATLNTAGSQTLTATDNTNAITGRSGAIAVSAGASHFAIFSATSVVAGNPFVFEVSALDSSGNVAANYSGIVHLSSSDGQALLPANALLTGGVGFFAAALKTAGTQTIVATDTATSSITGTSAPVTVIALAANHLAVTAPATAITGNPVSVTVTALDPFNNVAAGYAGTVHFSSSDASASLPNSATLTNGVGTFSTILKTAGSQTITATDTITASITGTTSQSIAAAGLTVTSFAPTSTGFVAVFNKPFILPQITLYDTAGANGPDDVTLTGPGSPKTSFRGSLIIDPTNTTITFVKTSDFNGINFNPSTGTLAPGTYTATLRSASNGFTDLLGNLLDSGSNFTTTFVVTAAPVVVGIPAFARGPDSADAINLPNNVAGAGIPINLSSGAGVTSGQFTLQYNPAFLSIAGATVNSGLTGATLSLDPSSTAGNAVIDFSSTAALSAAVIHLGSLEATVPNAAAAFYTQKALLHFSNVQLNGGAIAATGDDAVQVVAYLGDVNGDGQLGGGDAASISRVSAGFDNNPATGAIGGFSAYRLADPVILGDLTASGTVGAPSVTLINSDLAGTARAQLPAANPNSLTIPTNGPDPSLSVPSVLQASPGSTVVVPVNIDTARPEGSTGMTEAILGLKYDPQVFSVSAADVSLGTLPDTTSGWQLSTVINPLTGEIAIDLYGGSAIQTTASGSLVTITLHTRETAPASATGLIIVNQVNPTGQRVYTTTVEDAQGAFTLHPAAADEPGTPGLVTVNAAVEPPGAGLLQSFVMSSVSASVSTFGVQDGSGTAANTLPLGLVEQVFGSMEETLVQESAFVQPSAILTPEFNQSGTGSTDTSLMLQMGVARHDWVPADPLTHLGQTAKAGHRSPIEDILDGAGQDEAVVEEFFAREAAAQRGS